MSEQPETLAAILAEMRSSCGDVADHEVADYASRIEAAARHQFGKIRNFCQAEINSTISDHISSIFMLKVVRDVAESTLKSLSNGENGGRE